MLKKILCLLALASLLIPQMAFAQQDATLLPETTESVEDCETLLQDEGVFLDKSYFIDLDKAGRDNFLGCAIKTGRIKLWMIPFFITRFANFFIGIAGVVSLLFTLLGGFWYMTGGLTDDKEKGKKTITYALIGLVITLLAWIIVNVIIVQITG